MSRNVAAWYFITGDERRRSGMRRFHAIHPQLCQSLAIIRKSFGDDQKFGSTQLQTSKHLLTLTHGKAKAKAKSFSKSGTPSPVAGSQPRVAFQLAYGMMLPPTTGAPV